MAGGWYLLTSWCGIGWILHYALHACIMLTQHSAQRERNRERQSVSTLMSLLLLNSSKDIFPSPCPLCILLTDVTRCERPVCVCKLKLPLTDWWDKRVSFHLFFISTFLLLDPSIYPPFYVLSILPFDAVRISHSAGKTHKQTPTAPLTFSHTAINLCIDSPLHFHTVWTELKQDESFRRVHCFPHALAVYTGVLQTTSAQLRNWMY